MCARVSLFGAGIMLCFLATAALAEQPVSVNPTQRKVSLEVWAAVTRSPHVTIFDDVNVTVREGRVTLTGKVTNDSKRREITRRVASVAGVREVQDDLRVFPSSKLDDELRERIGRAIYGNAGFWHYAMLPNPSIHIIVEGSHVTLQGIVRTELDRTMAQALALQCSPLSLTNELKTPREIGHSLDGLE
jgi:hypothetical protein